MSAAAAAGSGACRPWPPRHRRRRLPPLTCAATASDDSYDGEDEGPGPLSSSDEAARLNKLLQPAPQIT